MTYRERRLAKAERLQEWADKREQKAIALRDRTPESLRHDHAFLTQPGIIPQRTKMYEADQRAYENVKKAHEFDSRAAGIIAAADRAIYSDDPDAIERLRERIAASEATRAEKVAANAILRKRRVTDGEGLELAITECGFSAGIAEQLRMQYRYMRRIGLSTANDSGYISAQRKRLAQMVGPEEEHSHTWRRNSRGFFGCTCGEHRYADHPHDFVRPSTEHYGGPQHERCVICGVRLCEHGNPDA